MSKNEITSINQSFLENVSEVLAQARKNAKNSRKSRYGLCLL